ncbi:hypothetical protein KPH14_003331 [Odynerus spinipes]|uniref:Uncharacterized protein n=1 Tax=Odynerus spinipes TaxID=1348599 RepID=A0AAD9VJT3_9HYME|nr:hypothetical protein KPH14_003331 [Odynerus spinipes]
MALFASTRPDDVRVGEDELNYVLTLRVEFNGYGENKTSNTKYDEKKYELPILTGWKGKERETTRKRNTLWEKPNRIRG